MGDDDFGPVVALLVVIPTIVAASVYSVLGGYVIYSVNNILPWQTVSPQAANMAQNAANNAVTILGLDPTAFLLAILLIFGTLAGLAAWAIFGGQGSDSGSDWL